MTVGLFPPPPGGFQSFPESSGCSLFFLAWPAFELSVCISSLFPDSVPKRGVPSPEAAHRRVWLLHSDEQEPRQGHLDRMRGGTEAGEASGQTVRSGRPGMGASVVWPPHGVCFLEFTARTHATFCEVSVHRVVLFGLDRRFYLVQ